LNRSLRDFLLRLAKSRDDATILRSTESPARDLARALNAHPKEKALVETYIQSMLDDGYLTHRDGRLWITNFVEAQAAVTPGARRQQTWRAKSKSPTGDVNQTRRETRGPPDSSVTVTPTVTAPETSRDTSLPIRSDPIRSDPIPTPDPEPVSVRAREAPSGGGGDFLFSSEESDPGRQTMCPPDLADRLESNGTLRRLAEQLPAPLESVRDCVRAFVATWTIGKLAGQRRSGWAGRARQWVIDQNAQGKLRPPGAIEHDRNGGREGPCAPDPALAALVASIGRGAA